MEIAVKAFIYLMFTIVGVIIGVVAGIKFAGPGIWQDGCRTGIQVTLVKADELGFGEWVVIPGPDRMPQTKFKWNAPTNSRPQMPQLFQMPNREDKEV